MGGVVFLKKHRGCDSEKTMKYTKKLGKLPGKRHLIVITLDVINLNNRIRVDSLLNSKDEDLLIL